MENKKLLSVSKDTLKTVYENHISEEEIQELYDYYNGIHLQEKPFYQIQQKEIDDFIECQYFLSIINQSKMTRLDIKQLVYQELEKKKQRESQQYIKKKIDEMPLSIEQKEKEKQIEQEVVKQEPINDSQINIFQITPAEIRKIPNVELRKELQKRFRNYYIYLNRFVTPSMDFEMESDENFTLEQFKQMILNERKKFKK